CAKVYKMNVHGTYTSFVNVTENLPLGANIVAIDVLRLRTYPYEEYDDFYIDSTLHDFHWVNCFVEISDNRKEFRLRFRNQDNSGDYNLSQNVSHIYVAVNIHYR
ncbi:MAG: hypothetical protein N2606_00380, partial [Candidatus Omnitrophica bacterium]|nr:hypothetical protein [Candidatus Omnitrophota bacterium]